MTAGNYGGIVIQLFWTRRGYYNNIYYFLRNKLNRIELNLTDEERHAFSLLSKTPKSLLLVII